MKRKLAIALLIAVVVYSFAVALSGVPSAGLPTPRPETIGLCIAIVAISYEARALRWAALLRILGVQVSMLAAHRSYLAGLSMAVTPGKAGELLKPHLLAEKEGVRIEKSLACLLLERSTDLLSAFVILALVATTFNLGLSAIAALAATFTFVLFTSSGKLRMLFGFTSRVKALRTVSEAASSSLSEFEILCRPRPFILALLIASVSWLLEASVLYVLLRELGAAPTLAIAVAAYCLGSIAGAVAFLPGGIGLAEGGIAGTLVVLGVGAAPAVAGVILVRLFTLWLPLAVGTFALMHWVRRDIYGKLGLRRDSATPRPEEQVDK
ncbi:MAG: flippase-like domain-containing protein [Euryarchaeota archaeon]|nr:flippase-like domain-containing protein [Euryarchaeota archaeon]